MTYEPTADAVWEVLLEGSQRHRSAVTPIGPTQTARDYLYETMGRDVSRYTFPEKKRVARNLNSGGISARAIACILHLEDRKSTVDYWIRGIDPEETIGLDGKVRRPKRSRKTRVSQPEPSTPPPPEPTPREFSRKAVLDALIELRRAEVPIEDRPVWLRKAFFPDPGKAPRERYAIAVYLRESGFTPSVIAPIAGVSVSQVYKWTKGIESGLRYGIRGTELGDGTEAENLF